VAEFHESRDAGAGEILPHSEGADAGIASTGEYLDIDPRRENRGNVIGEQEDSIVCFQSADGTEEINEVVH
ncbi:unnamed protein product, partial [marine sediment metagenome]